MGRTEVECSSLHMMRVEWSTYYMIQSFSSSSDNGMHTFRKELIFGERVSATSGSVSMYCRSLFFGGAGLLLFLSLLRFLQKKVVFLSQKNLVFIMFEGVFCYY